MKNIHVLATDKPSRVYIVNSIGKLDWSEGYLHQVDGATNQHIYITSDEEIKEGDWVLLPSNEIYKMSSTDMIHYLESESKSTEKIILTTDTKLIEDGVQAIDDEFLEWFVNNSTCEEVKVLKYKSNNMRKMNLGYKIILPKEEPDWEELENSGLDKSFKLIEEPKTAWVGVLHDKLNEYYPAEYELKDIYQGEGCLPNFPDEELCQIWCDSKYKEEPNYNMKQEILDEMKKQETLKEYIERETKGIIEPSLRAAAMSFLRYGAKWQQEQDKNKFSGEDMKQFGDWCRNGLLNTEYGLEKLDEHLEQWKQLKKK